MAAITAPLPQFFDRDGTPLDGGEIWIGLPNLNPEASNAAVYWDAAMTQPAAMPLATINGSIARAGTPALVYIGGDYSVLVRDRQKRQVYYAANSADFALPALVDALRTDLASTASGKGAALIGTQDAGDYWPTGPLETILATTGAYLRKRCNPMLHPWNAKFDGATDDTAAINACFAYAATNNLTVELPAGTAIVTNLLYGTQATGAQSSSPAGLIGPGAGATRLKAKAGTAGVLLKAWSIAGGSWHGFTVDCNSQAGLIGIDTTWKPGVGPSLQCVFSGVWVESYASTGWLADNNNDVSFFKCNIRNPVLLNQVALQIRASGGLVSMRDCTWSSGLLDISAQNVELTACWGHGIRFAAGATNVVLMNACYLYGSPVTNAIISTNGVASGTKIQSMEINGGWIDCTQGYSVINARIGSGVRFNGCTFSPTGGTISALLLGPGCTRDLGNGRVMVELNNCRAEYNSSVSQALDMDFTPAAGFTILRRGYDKTGVQVNDDGLVIRYSSSVGAVTAGTWYPLTSGNELTPGLWDLDVLWTPGGAPFYVGAAATVRTILTNAAAAGLALPGVNCISHAHSGALISIRPAANTTGLASDFEWSPSVPGAAGTLTVTCTKRS
jgi:hypothetical protein